MVFVLYVVLAALPRSYVFSSWRRASIIRSTDSAELTLFFAFNAINLPWVALRYFSIAIDEYVYFEMLEALRRGINTVALLGAPGRGCPPLSFCLLINAGWIVAISAAIAKLPATRDFHRRFPPQLHLFCRVPAQQSRQALQQRASMRSARLTSTTFLISWCRGPLASARRRSFSTRRSRSIASPTSSTAPPATAWCRGRPARWPNATARRWSAPLGSRQACAPSRRSRVCGVLIFAAGQDFRRTARPRGRHAAGDDADHHHAAPRQSGADGVAQRPGAYRLLQGSGAHFIRRWSRSSPASPPSRSGRISTSCIS